MANDTINVPGDQKVPLQPNDTPTLNSKGTVTSAETPQTLARPKEGAISGATLSASKIIHISSS